MKRAGVLVAVFILSSFPARAFCVEVSNAFLEEPRKRLEEKGLSFESVYVGDMVSTLRGGLKQKSSYLGYVNMAMTFDLAKAGVIPGGKAYVSAHDTHGGENPTEQYVGDLQGVDNIEAPDAMRLYEYWYEQNWFGEKLSVLAGMHALDSEFAVTDFGCLFLHSSFGTPPDLSANTPVSIFPIAGPGVRAKLKPHERFEFLTGIYDGDPTDGGKNRHGVRYRLSSHQGIMLIFEGIYHPGIDLSNIRECFRPTLREAEAAGRNLSHGSIKFGAWLHTKDVDDVLETDENGAAHRHQKNFGFYGVLDQMVFREKSGEDEGLGIFVQLGGTPDDRNTVDFYLGAGLNYKGLIPARDQDVFGVAAANAFLSGDLRKARDLEIASYDPETGSPPGRMKANESALEMTYRIQLHKRLAIQPDYQIVFNPSGEENSKTAHVLLLRIEMTF